MNKLFQIVFLLFGFCLNSFGQNSIDELIGKYSTMGNSTYSSIVKRDPQTKKVVSVYNELKLSNSFSGEAHRFKKSFEDEAKNADSQEKNVKGNTVNYLLRYENENQARLYMMEYDSNRGFLTNITVSIIIKNKKR